MANERMTFTLVGRDNLSREFNRAGASAAELQRDIERASARARESLAGLQRDAQGRLRDVRGRFVSTARAAELMGDSVDDSFTRVGDSADRASMSFRRLKFELLGLGVAAAVPAAAAGAAALMSLAAAAGAATAGVVSFGLAIAPQIKDIASASEATTKLEEAVVKHGAGSSEAAAAQDKLNAALGEAGTPIRGAIDAFLELRRTYEDWSEAVSGDTMPVLTKSFETFGAMLPDLTPLVRATARELDGLVTVAAGAVARGTFGDLVEQLSEFTGEVLHRATIGIANLNHTLASLDTSMWDRFMQLADEHGPAVAESLANVAQAIGNILLAAGDAGAAVLQVANALAQMVNAIPPELLSTIVQIYAAFRLYGLAAAAVAKVSVAMAALNARLVTMQARATAAGGAMAALRARMAAMSAGGVAGLAVAAAAAVAYAINELAENARGAPPDVDRLTTSLKELGTSGKVTGELAKALGGLNGVADAFRRASVDAKGFKAINDAVGPSITGSVREMHDLIDSFVRGEESAKASREQIGSLDKSLASLVKAGHGDLAAEVFGKFAARVRQNGDSVKEFKGSLTGYRDALDAAKVAQQLAADGMGLFGDQAVEVTGKIQDQIASAEGLKRAYHDLNTMVLEARGGIRGMEAAIDDATESFKENGATLDLNTEAGRENQQALDQIAVSTMKAAEAAAQNNAKWSTVAGIYDRGRAALVRTAEQMGLTSAQAEKLADRILRVPDRTVLFEGDISDLDQKIEAAQRHVDSLKQQRATTLKGDRGPIDAAVRRAQDRVDSLRQKRAALLKARDATGPGVNSAQANINSLRGKTVDIFVNVWRRVRGNQSFTLGTAPGSAQGGLIRGYADGGEVQGFPVGGPVIGPGTSTSDSIPAMLSDGEFVVKAAAVQKYGVGLLDAINQMRVQARPTSTAGAGAMVAAGSTTNTTFNVYPQRADFTVHDLEALQRRADVRARVGRPR